MPDASPSQATNQRSSILFALGKLTAEMAGLKEAQDKMPGQVLAVLQPTIQDHGSLLLDHNTRLRALERHQWIWLGGGSALFGLATLVGTIVIKPSFHL